MKRFKNILVVVKPDEVSADNPAVVRGADLAKTNEARLTLMGVISPPGRALSQFKGIFEPGELVAMLSNEFEQSLSSLADKLGASIDVQVKVATGKDFIEIIRQVIYGKHDLLIKVANDHPHSFDSSDFHLMRKCPKPVWLHKNLNQGQCRKVLAAVDLELEDDEDGKNLNALIMDFATSIAEWENAELHILSCWALYGENTLRDSAFIRIPDHELDKLLVQEEHNNRVKQDALVARYSHVAMSQHIIKGQPAEHIPAFVREHGVDTVVMGTVARSGIPGLLIGNTAETILRQIDSSVVTLKPSGFESIVK